MSLGIYPLGEGHVFTWLEIAHLGIVQKDIPAMLLADLCTADKTIAVLRVEGLDRAYENNLALIVLVAFALSELGRLRLPFLIDLDAESYVVAHCKGVPRTLR